MVLVLLFSTLYSSFAIILMGKSIKKNKPSKQKCVGLTSLWKDKTGISALKDNGRLFNIHKDKAKILNRQYQSTFTKEDDDQIPSPSITPYPNMGEIDGIRTFLQKIKPRKATGPDDILARILKDCASELAPILTFIFNRYIQEGTVLEDWGQFSKSLHFRMRQTIKQYRSFQFVGSCLNTSLSICLYKHCKPSGSI